MNLYMNKRGKCSKVGYFGFSNKLSAAKLTTEDSVPQLKRLSLCDNKKYVSL